MFSTATSPGTMPLSIARGGERRGRERGGDADRERDEHEDRPASGRAARSAASPRTLRPRSLVPRRRRRESSQSRRRRSRKPGVLRARPAGGRRRAGPSGRARSQARHLGLERLAGEEDLVGQALLDDLAVERRTRRSSSSCVPCAISPPSSRTTISSASEIVDRRWAMTNVVRPVMTSRSASLICCSVEASTLEVASSRIRMRGSASSARAIARRWRWPPESVRPRSPTRVS